MPFGDTTLILTPSAGIVFTASFQSFSPASGKHRVRAFFAIADIEPRQCKEKRHGASFLYFSLAESRFLYAFDPRKHSDVMTLAHESRTRRAWPPCGRSSRAVDVPLLDRLLRTASLSSLMTTFTFLKVAHSFRETRKLFWALIMSRCVQGVKHSQCGQIWIFEFRTAPSVTHGRFPTQRGQRPVKPSVEELSALWSEYRAASLREEGEIFVYEQLESFVGLHPALHTSPFYVYGLCVRGLTDTKPLAAAPASGVKIRASYL